MVRVVDGHGSGSPEPDIILDRLDPRAEMLSRSEPFEAYVDIVEAGAYVEIVALIDTICIVSSCPFDIVPDGWEINAGGVVSELEVLVS